jgi:hypothetical protein
LSAGCNPSLLSQQQQFFSFDKIDASAAVTPHHPAQVT